MWQFSRLVFFASHILDAGLKLDRVQICVYLKSITSIMSVSVITEFWLSARIIPASEVYPRLFFSLYFRILTLWFLLPPGSLNQSFAHSLGPWENISASELVRWSSTEGEVKAPVYGRRWFARLMTSVKTSLDMTHRQCPRVRHGHSGYGGGYGPLAGQGKEDVTYKVSDSPFTNLTPEVTSTKNPYSLDDFLVVEMFINEGSWPIPVGQVESEGFAAFRPQETPLFLVNDGLLRCLRHASWCNQHPIVTMVLSSSLTLFQTSCIWGSETALGSECNLLPGERDFFVTFYCNTQSYCIRERLVSLSCAGI